MTECPTCSTCKHWDTAQEWNGYTGLPIDGWGECVRILGPGSSCNLPDTPAYLSDGSGYYASLTTRHDFGCLLYEPRGREDHP